MVVHRHVILETTLVKRHTLILNLLVPICHVLGSDDVTLIVDERFVRLEECLILRQLLVS